MDFARSYVSFPGFKMNRLKCPSLVSGNNSATRSTGSPCTAAKKNSHSFGQGSGIRPCSKEGIKVSASSTGGSKKNPAVPGNTPIGCGFNIFAAPLSLLKITLQTAGTRFKDKEGREAPKLPHPIQPFFRRNRHLPAKIQ